MNRKDLITSLSASFIVFVIGGIYQLIFGNLSAAGFLKTILLILAKPVYIPFWLLLSAIAFFLILLLKISSARIQKGIIGSWFSKSTNGKEMFKASIGNHKTLDSNLFISKSGYFSIWAHVTEEFQKAHSHGKNLYILGHATNDGAPLENINTLYYPNSLGIVVTPPFADNDYPNWNFFCNHGIDKTEDTTRIEFKRALSIGWHLFTFSWSEPKNYIKFYVDLQMVGEKEYLGNWPSSFAKKVFIGTWPNMASEHYYGNKIGQYKLASKELNAKSLGKFYLNKPH